jgi:hypothetical protein
LYKFIFTLLTDPLGLPISPIWEYVILAILNEIAFKIAWNVSPGGAWGSEIHWAVRIPFFCVMWAITYASCMIYTGQAQRVPLGLENSKIARESKK